MAENYLKIFRHTVSYIPSKLLVLLNSLIIIPLFSRVIEAKEISIYFIAIQFLNILCTCSSDWITKSILRFHEQYDIKNRLEDFYSNILSFTILTQFVAIVIYFFFMTPMQMHFGVDKTTMILSASLVIPCGIRQMLYQYLRVNNNTLIYTLSILFYQILFITFFLLLIQNVPDATSILVAMNIALFLIDIYILRKINFSFSINFSLNISKEIIFEILHYASPIVLTNVCYWFMLHFSKMYFQNNSMFLYTAIIGFFLTFVYYIIQPVASVFMFAGFPELVKKFEHNKPIKEYWTSILQLYVICVLPITLTFFYYYNQITQIVFPKEYYIGAIMLPFFALSVFVHEMTKLVNSKYHLNKMTYIEMIIAIVISVFSLFLNLILLHKYDLLGAAIVLCVVEISLIAISILIRIKNFEYINYIKIFKSMALVSILSFVVYTLIELLFKTNIDLISTTPVLITKIALYVVLFYVACITFRKQILG